MSLTSSTQSWYSTLCQLMDTPSECALWVIRMWTFSIPHTTYHITHITVEISQSTYCIHLPSTHPPIPGIYIIQIPTKVLNLPKMTKPRNQHQCQCQCQGESQRNTCDRNKSIVNLLIKNLIQSPIFRNLCAFLKPFLLPITALFFLYVTIRYLTRNAQRPLGQPVPVPGPSPADPQPDTSNCGGVRLFWHPDSRHTIDKLG